MITGVNKNEGAAFASFSLNQTLPPSPEELELPEKMFVCSVDKEAKCVDPLPLQFHYRHIWGK